MRIYIAGPMGGLPNGNRQAFIEAEEWLNTLGHQPLNPARITLPEGASWLDAMRQCLELIANADGLALLPGWIRSRGACVEFQLARGLGLEIRVLEKWQESIHHINERNQK